MLVFATVAVLLIFLAVMQLPNADGALRLKNALDYEKEHGGEDPASR